MSKSQGADSSFQGWWQAIRLARSGAPADWQKVIIFLLVWGAAVIIALSLVNVSNLHAPPIWTRNEYGLRHGYTKSLILLLLPLAGLIWWYCIARKDDHDRRLQQLMRGVFNNALVTALGLVVFDVLFATLLFDFPDTNSVIGFNFPGYMWAGECSTIWQFYRPACYARTIPVEEVAFYLLGAAVLRGMYIWASEDFLSRYTIEHSTYVFEATKVKRLVTWHWGLIALVAMIVTIGFLVKRQHGGGYPIYLMLQLLVLFAPVVFLYTRVSPFINTRAFLMVVVLQVFISVIWEVTTAIPYGWWDYKPVGMMGQFVQPWSEIPVEACFFWIVVGWSAIFLHEATKIKVRSNRSWWSLLFGAKS